MKRMFALKAASRPPIALSRAIQALPTFAADQGNARKPRIDRQPGFICPQVAAQLPSPTFSTTGC